MLLNTRHQVEDDFVLLKNGLKGVRRTYDLTLLRLEQLRMGNESLFLKLWEAAKNRDPDYLLPAERVVLKGYVGHLFKLERLPLTALDIVADCINAQGEVEAPYAA